MALLNPSSAKSPLKLRLNRDLTRAVKRGHPWVFADALRALPTAAPGTPAILLDNKKGREIARGYYDPDSPLAFRVCTPEAGVRLDDNWAEAQMMQAINLRRSIFDAQTTGFRLFNGEGDGLPGLVCDVYGDTAVIKLDGEGPSGFYDAPGIARRVADALSLKAVYQRQERRRQQDQSGEKGRALVGKTPAAPVEFLENGLRFTADVVNGQKTGFFLDQRDNRQQIGQFSQSRRVLNVFGYTGGFSIYAGAGHADHVTTVDLAAPAIEVARQHWQLNNLPPDQHTAVTDDAFAFLEQAARKKRTWDLVILDPPSFAPSKSLVKKGLASYRKMIAAGAQVTTPGELLAVASCSSHITLEAFLAVCEEGISEARRRGVALSIHGQPADHPAPLVLPEFRYLKFALFRLV